MSVQISLQIVPQRGSVNKLREQWIKADEMGTDVLWVADHFFAQVVDSAQVAKGQAARTDDAENYEAMCIQAAMAATTKHAKIGCLVHAIHYRNPNLLADMARTIDHISNGRYILGVGAGYIERDYVEYGYPYGTQKSRLLDLKEQLPVIKQRLERLIPPPVGKLPILVASMGDKVGLPIVAEFADMWHVMGPMDVIRYKHDMLLKWCKELGRDPAEIEVVASCQPELFDDADPDVLYDELGIKHIHTTNFGPEWDLGYLRELLEWRKSRFGA